MFYVRFLLTATMSSKRHGPWVGGISPEMFSFGLALHACLLPVRATFNRRHDQATGWAVALSYSVLFLGIARAADNSSRELCGAVFYCWLERWGGARLKQLGHL